MSFILDALKKSESDRQRASGPALFEVKVARTRSGLPGWGIALGALLGVNLAILAWLLLRHPVARGADAAAPPGGAPAALTAPGPGAAGPAAPAAMPATTAAAPASPVPQGSAANASAPSSAPPPASSPAPAGTTAAGESPEDYAPAAEPTAPAFAAHVQRR